MSNKKLDLKYIPEKINELSARLRPYSFLIFILFVALLYGFVLMKINSLSQAEPTAEAVTGQVKAAQVPHIDEAVVKQLESLEDNSVSVQTLFNEARSNPFQ